MKAWFRKVLPWEGLLWGFAAAYLACYLPDLMYWYHAGAWRDHGYHPHDPAHVLPRIVIMASVLIYGVLRVYAFHPAFRKDYFEWLKQTPWRYGLPLPLGPVHLVWQDAVIVGVLSRFAWWHWQESWWVVPCGFLAVYLLLMVVSFIRTGDAQHAYLLMFGLGGTLLVLNSPVRLGVLLAGLYLAAVHGLRHSLGRIEDWDWAKFNERLGLDFEGKERRLGWPFDFLGPPRQHFPVSTGWAAAIGILAGWWVYGVAGLLRFAHHWSTFHGCVVAFGCLLAGGRLMAYIIGYMPPISFWGRVRTFRWIIPRYDVVFVAPLLILALLATLIWVPEWDLPHGRLLSAITAAYVFVALGFPPSLEKWRLTGSHRIIPAVPKQEMQQLP